MIGRFSKYDCNINFEIESGENNINIFVGDKNMKKKNHSTF